MLLQLMILADDVAMGNRTDLQDAVTGTALEQHLLSLQVQSKLQ